MNHFEYRDGDLFAEDVPIHAIAVLKSGIIEIEPLGRLLANKCCVHMTIR